MTPAGPLADLFRLAGAGLWVGALLVAGCEKGPAAAEGEKKAAAARPASPDRASEPAGAEIKVTIDSSGRKWLTPTIPYDVYGDVPSDEEAATAAATAPSETPGSPAPGMTLASTDRAPSEPAPPQTSALENEPPISSPVASAPESWDAVLPAESLQREIASVRNDLSQKLLTVGSYNESFESVGNDGWLMAALATIAQEHPASISWKGNSLLARDAAVAIASAATARGRKNFGDAQLASEQLTAVLDNNTPNLPAPDPAASREETADRAALMARMQAAFDRLKASAADDAVFRKELDASGHEARILAALAKFTAHTDYTSADEADYQAAAADLVAAGSAMAEAAAAEDRAGFTAALDRVGTACNKCHEKFRFEN